MIKFISLNKVFRINSIPAPEVTIPAKADVLSSKDIHDLVKQFADQDVAMYQFLHDEGYNRRYKVSHRVASINVTFFYAKYIGKDRDKAYDIPLRKTRNNPKGLKLILREGDISGAQKRKDLRECLEKAFLCRDIMLSDSAFTKRFEIEAFAEQVERFVRQSGLDEKAAPLLKNLAMPENRIDHDLKDLDALERLYKARFNARLFHPGPMQKLSAP